MYRNILIPVSLDEDRDLAGAIEAATTLADDNARLTLAHVIEPTPTYATEVIPPDIWADRRKAAETRMRDLAQGLTNAHRLVLEGPTGRTITEWAKENQADCIVIASHRPVFSDLFLGSTATWVVRHAHCAVHVIR